MGTIATIINAQVKRVVFTLFTGAVRADGASEYLMPANYPAVSHYEVVQALADASKKYKEVTAGVGLIATVGTFYDGPLGNHNTLWRDAKVLAVEMEVSTLLVIASLRYIYSSLTLSLRSALAALPS